MEPNISESSLIRFLEQDCEKYAKASFQIQIRDDGSVDGTQDILEEYAGKISREAPLVSGRERRRDPKLF